ncbi:family S53 protease [Auriscalpium vulgare]|uniref:Family S53 protease n=1 Tax=Auriscalpium vulgare TaxID=40419 RepID=A0ACB8R3F0_9AGAM|nr:family S53 protease [Auriscalpium vulgare]
MARSYLLLASLISVACAVPNVSRDTFVHVRRDSAPAGFVHVGPASDSQVLTMRVGLTQSNTAGLIDALYSVSTPGSDKYGQHLSKAAVEAFTAPTDATTASVHAWLSSHNVTFAPATPAGDWLKLSVTVSQANRLLNTNFATFKNQATGKETVRTLSYSLPTSLEGKIAFVHPTTVFPIQPFGKNAAFKPNSAAKRAPDAAPQSCATQFTPACLQELYSINANSTGQASNVIAVSGFLGQYANEADLAAFLASFRPDIPSNTTFATKLLDGGVNPQDMSDAGQEANLDTQYAIGVAGTVPVQFISVGFNNDDDFGGNLDILEFLSGESPVPTVLTTSYGYDEDQLPFDLANSVCNAYAALGAQGTSILFASGDGGVAGGQGRPCTTFIPTFPSTCPFVTSVGGTRSLNPELAASLSSGGFSNFFPTPDYQASDVSAFLAGLGSTYAGLFNASGRAFPDVSAVAEDVEIVWEAQFGTIEGTSCSSPILAGLIGLLNDELISAGKPPLGFLNPFLYANQDIFTDITSGANRGCGTPGFSAGVGWDPITGVGSPVYASLRTAVGLT